MSPPITNACATALRGRCANRVARTPLLRKILGSSIGSAINCERTTSWIGLDNYLNGRDSRQAESIYLIVRGNVDPATRNNAGSAVRARARHQFIGAAPGIDNSSCIPVVPM